MKKTKVTIVEPETHNKVFPMSEMKPGQICKIVNSTCNEYLGKIVMRTLAEFSFEVMDLTDFNPNKYWEGSSILVTPVDIGTKIILEVVDDE